MDTSTSSRTTSCLGYSFANLSPCESICPNRSKPNSLHLPYSKPENQMWAQNFFISSKSESQMEAQRPCIPASQKTRWKYKISWRSCYAHTYLQTCCQLMMNIVLGWLLMLLHQKSENEEKKTKNWSVMICKKITNLDEV